MPTPISKPKKLPSANLERSMLYGFQLEMTHWVRKDKDKLGAKPDLAALISFIESDEFVLLVKCRRQTADNYRN